MSYLFPINEVKINNKKLYSSIELKIKEQGVTVIVGTNGCGKTTLINQILFNNPDSVLIIGQENDLIFENKNIEENIMLFNKDITSLDQLLKRLNMEYILTRKPSQLSGGEKRIISLLRLFFVDKDILILDEPTNDLDYRTVNIIKDIIIEISKNKSILIVTHDDRIIDIAENKYAFLDGEIKSNQFFNEVNKPLPIKKNKYNIDNFIKNDIYSFLLFILVVISILGAELSYVVFKPKQIEYIIDNQSNLATKQYASIQKMIEEGYLPISIYLEYEGTIDLDFLKLYSDKLEDAIMNGGSNNMYIQDDYGECVYMGVFWDPKTDEKIYPLRDYQELYRIVNGKDIDISSYITIFDGITEIMDLYNEGDKINIDQDLYKDLEKAYYNLYPNLQPRLYIVLGENRNVLSYASDLWFIKNNTTIDISNKVNILINIKNFLIITILSLFGSIGIYILYFFISLKLIRKKIVVFRNFGVPYDDVFKTLFNKKCMAKEKIFVLITSIIINTILTLLFADRIVLIIMTIISIISYFSLMILSRSIIKKCIEKTYSFGGIYEN